MTEPPRTQPPAVPRIDALMPPEMALACEAAGVAKSSRDAVTLLALGVLAGAFIALGAVFMTVVLTGAGDLPWGVARLLAGLVFSLGLILVIAGGAELFTGNSLIVMALAQRRITLVALLRNWALVFVANFAGAIAVAVAVAWSGVPDNIAAIALRIAEGKVALDPFQAFVRGILCNVLVCLAVWLCFAARTATDKVLVIPLPIAAFVALGFEHSIANMFFLPLGMLLGSSVIDLSGMMANLVPVTLGNIIGGGALVGGVYWAIYLRGRVSAPPSEPR